MKDIFIDGGEDKAIVFDH